MRSTTTARTGGSKLNHVVNVAILFTLAVVLLRGQLAHRAQAVLDNWRTSRALAEVWPELIESGSKLVGSSIQPQRTVVEFIDYECPYCRRGAARVAESVAGEEVDVVIRHLPLEGIHPWARPAARAAICSERYGVFAKGHAALLGKEEWMANSDWEAWALALGIDDIVAFRRCLEDEKTTRRIQEDMWLADRLGVTGTPVFVTAKGVFPGDFEAAVASLAEKIISDAPGSGAGWITPLTDQRTAGRD